MDKQVSENKLYPIEISLQGARNCISISKGTIKALGTPTHVSLKISDTHDSISVFPCHEDDVMAFRVPAKLFLDHKCVMRINSKRFVQGIMRTNDLDVTKTYTKDMAEAMNIPMEDLRWYAAFHNESHHPHCHIIAYVIGMTLNDYRVPPGVMFMTRSDPQLTFSKRDAIFGAIIGNGGNDDGQLSL